MNDELYHYGVKGMKWGIRRYQNKDGTLTAQGKKRASDNRKPTYGWSKDAKRANSIKKKSVKQMTNKELQTLNKRMELESKYNQLNPSKVKKGMKVVGTVAATMGTIATLYNNADRIIKIGREISKKIAK